ncbi:unnamed protein product [Linum tenue]|uniref:Cysteine-rich receptor-like protein kinase 10 n=1 Tax=Linum tenue TaxID=586396 RepID=A0AAV0PC58_9ROSI|nr:unnamed protein product [Linum tenue]
MIPSKLSLLLVLLSIQITTTVLAQSPDPVYLTHVCPNATSFPPNSTFGSNLNLLLSNLSAAAANGEGFHYAESTAGNDSSSATYGLYLCRGDITPKECQNCIDFATTDTLNHCPNQKTAIVWYDRCLVRYSNRSAFSVQPDTFMLYNTRNVSEPDRFNELLGRVMNEIVAEAANGEAKKFATKGVELSAFQSLYTLAQCTDDLSEENCDRCLRTCLSLLPSCCGGKQGGRVLLPSCNIRYEVYPFYEGAAVATAAPPYGELASSPSPSPAGGGRISSGVIAAIVAPIAVFAWILGLGCCFLSSRRRRATRKLLLLHNSTIATQENEIPNAESLQFDLATIEAATENFVEGNKLGQGGFGVVYRGTLTTGEEIAVKRLSKSSGQGEEEFKNEVLLVAKLQHRNLVKLLGFCLEGDERILVYEFVPNKSLDHFLYADEMKMLLDWASRYHIIAGIARGILYLHEDSRLKIIHRDLKASNILLDKDMKPKISDFGMARIFGVDQTQANTNRIVGTYGYMSPEYAMYGQFSAKSDVYSFGVLLLEIITGLRNSTFTKKDGAQDLLGYVWRNWRDGTPLEVLDATLLDSCSTNEVMRCIYIGLLCVQENPADRPTMAAVVLMLSGYSVSHLLPKQPAFFSPTRATGGGGRRTELMVLADQSDHSGSKSVLWSIDEASITDIYPR